ncbi:MAG: hypothetical protein QME85_10235 [Candidatus Saccharicenans sp.]|nr:hypothetical protein [Candidatus Saccharicenans sp.]MDI6849850.1 hypothetical protein [Candidatus Saccharicenans sp.]
MKTVRLIRLLMVVFSLTGLVSTAVADVELDTVPLQVANAILFRDHADPNVFYYMPNQPRLAYWPDGTPKLTFLKYTRAGKEESKGGILHFFVKYGLDEQELAKVRQELTKINPKATIKGPLVFKKGNFMVVSAAVGEGGAFTRKIIGEGKAPLISGSEVSVSIAVTPEGATFLEEALKQPTYPVSVRFEMTYEGLTPKYQATATIHWSKVREYFDQYSKWRIYKKRKLGIWTWYVQTGTGELREMKDELTSKGAVRVDITGEDQNLDSLMQSLVDTIMREMFDTKLELPEEDDAKGEEEKKQQDRPYGVSTTRKKVSRTDDWTINMTKRLRQERDTGPMDASIGEVLRKYKNNKKVFDIINLDDPDLQDRVVYAILDGEDFETFRKYINFVTVSFKKAHKTGEPTTRDVIFNAQTLAERGNMLSFVYPRLGEGATWLSYEYKTTWSFVGGIKVESPWTRSEEAAINLFPPHRYRQIDIIADEENVRAYNIKLITVTFKNRFADREKTGEVKLLPAETLLARYEYVHAENDLNFQYQVTWLLGDGRRVQSGWQRTTEPFVYALYQEK